MYPCHCVFLGAEEQVQGRQGPEKQTYNEVVQSWYSRYGVQPSPNLEIHQDCVCSTVVTLWTLQLSLGMGPRSWCLTDSVECALLILLATYYVFDIDYPRTNSMILGFMQQSVLCQPFTMTTTKDFTSMIHMLQWTVHVLRWDLLWNHMSSCFPAMWFHCIMVYMLYYYDNSTYFFSFMPK